MTLFSFSLACCLLMVYAFVLFRYILGWNGLRSSDVSRFVTADLPRVCVVLPVRNESDNILNILDDLLRQDYPANLLDVIVSDDDSEDQTVHLVKGFVISHPGCNVSVVLSHDEGGVSTLYKKGAIARALKKSDADLILTTDADCRVGKSWVSSIVGYYLETGHKMICAPVCYETSNMFSRMQALEFSALMGATGGAIAWGHPLMCNGANLAYERSAFFHVGGYGIDEAASGDDMFLMFRMQRFFPGSVGFVKSKDAMVHTRPNHSAKAFFMQRRRWASKTPDYDMFYPKFVAALVYSVNFFSILLFILCLYAGRHSMVAFVLFFFFKCAIDFALVFSVSSFMHLRRHLLLFLPAMFIYPIYVSLTGAMALVGGYTWKGRGH
jgi:cellulose synthase/poly-beta-1,6-N-acetylglucosamine synthase-like glycosyltransferase